MTTRFQNKQSRVCNEGKLEAHAKQRPQAMLHTKLFVLHSLAVTQTHLEKHFSAFISLFIRPIELFSFAEARWT